MTFLRAQPYIKVDNFEFMGACVLKGHISEIMQGFTLQISAFTSIIDWELLVENMLNFDDICPVTNICKVVSVFLRHIVCVLTASAGAAAGGILYFVSYLPFTFIGAERRYPDVTANAKFGISLVPTLAMTIGCKNLAQFESTGVLRFYLLYCIHRHT